jgi:dihydroorotate dehydrogenase
MGRKFPKIDVQGTPRLDVEIAGVRFKNPVLTASGTFAYGDEYLSVIFIRHSSFVIRHF